MQTIGNECRGSAVDGRAPDVCPSRDRTGATMAPRLTAADTERLEADQDYPVATMGEAARLLGVQPAFLRSLDAAGFLTPQRSPGGHRRYSRHQLALAARMRELFDEGMTLDAAARVVTLQDELAITKAALAAARDELAATRRQELRLAREQLEAARARVAELEARDQPA